MGCVKVGFYTGGGFMSMSRLGNEEMIRNETRNER
jgi:hypothetical protein